MPRLPLAALACLACAVLVSPTRAASDSRTAFLKLLERPRVALAPEVSAPVEHDGLVEIAFSFSSDARNRVPGILIKPAIASPPATRRPVVINLHGTGGNKDGQRKLLIQLARAGFIGVAIDGRYHGARAKGGKAAKSTEYVAAALRAFRQPGTEYPFFYDTAWDIMRLIDYLATRDDVDAHRIGLWGFSKGGIETYLAAAADPRIAAAVSCIGVQTFRWAIENDAWQSRMSTIQGAFDAAAKESGVAQPGADFVRTFYDRVAPGIYGDFDGPAMLPLIAPRPLLAINGDSDIRTPMPGLLLCIDAARAAYRVAGAEKNFTFVAQLNTGHKVTPDSMQLVHTWLVQQLKP